MAGHVRIIQWNCRSFAKKRAALQFALANFDPGIDVIALQETETETKIAGYATYNEISTGKKPRTAIAVQRNIASMQIDLELENVHYTFVQLMPKRRKSKCLYILNIYSPPKSKTIPFAAIIRKARKEAANEQLIVLGDFNAHHTMWGYQRSTKKGAAILNGAQATG